ncbi:MAG: dihydroxy-acid dehydratase [Dehalococcoidia bacterium]|nr:dihydroxy-acid dehydratase [Dehalococcoidia bacterium]
MEGGTARQREYPSRAPGRTAPGAPSRPGRRPTVTWGRGVPAPHECPPQGGNQGGTAGARARPWSGGRRALSCPGLHARIHLAEGYDTAARRGITSTVCFPTGNLAPDGSVIKSTAIDPSVLDSQGVYRMTGPARMFCSEAAAIAAVKSTGEDRIRPGDVIVLAGLGPMGTGMEEVHQITAALKYLEFGKHVALVTDSRFSGVSTGACIGLVSPEGLAGGPIGRVREGDRIEIVIDTRRLEGTVNMVGDAERVFGPEEGARVLASRPPHPDLKPDPLLPADTRLWAALQAASGGPWAGAVYDLDAILGRLQP